MIKAIFLDFDGTLFSHTTHQIPDSACLAVRSLQKNGYLVFICTGRSKLEMDSFDLRGLKFSGMILNSGQVLLDKDDKVFFDSYLDGILLDKIIKLFKQKEVAISLNSERGFYLNYVNDYVRYVDTVVSGAVPEIGEYQAEKITSCSIFLADEKAQEALKDIEEYAEVSYWLPQAVDIAPKGINKATGIMKMGELYGFNLDECVGVGDSNNDMSMLSACKIGIAMGNGDQDAKSVADYISDDIDQDGLYNACKHFGLI